MPTVNLFGITGSTTGWSSGSDHMAHGRQYAFFLRETDVDPAPTYYSEILRTAKFKVHIWDPYFWKDDTAVFECFRHRIEVTVLTSKSSQRTGYLQELIDETKNHIDPSATDSNFKFGFIDTDKHGKVFKSHDRFLIIDDNECYLIGASVEYHRRAIESTGIYHIEHDEDRGVIKTAFNKVLTICENDGTCRVETI